MLPSDAVSAACSHFEEMKRYVRFSGEDARALAAFRAHAAPRFPAIADQFYDRIREHEEAHAVFTGEEQVTRLQQSLVRWMERICSGPYDAGYCEETAQIGRVHVRIGLPHRYMFTAMALLRLAFEGIVAEAPHLDGASVRMALAKILDIELAVMTHAYCEAFIERAEGAVRLEGEAVRRSLARAEHRYETAVELAKILVVGLDASGAVRLFNHEAERVTGYGREEVVGRDFVAALLPDELRESQGVLLQRSARGDASPPEVLDSHVTTRAGKVRSVRWQLAYAPSAADDEVVLFAIGPDTTDELALASRVRQSERLAAIGTLAAGLAHEIRNPLNGAQLHVTFLERGLVRSGVHDTDTADAIKVVREEIRRLSGLVSEFLDFARPAPLAPEPTSLIALCQRALQLAAPDAEAAAVELRPDLPTTDIVLDLDPGRMEQVLLNLLRNAIEAVQSTGEGAVTLRARRAPADVIVEVEDQGPGVANPDAPIFDPFFSTKPQGTGLGLAVVHRIVSDHDGSIDFRSRPGKTVFRVTVPIRPSSKTRPPRTS